ncbi:MAG: hypothetical protein IIA51_06445 [Chloroflexi bacterium]|nr:hypothetical protein [Chloroflexota bacterium]
MTRLDRRVARRFARVLTVVAILALPIAATFGYAPAAASPGSAPELQAFTFTPNITAINFTVTPEATPIDTLEPQPSPTAEGESEDGEEVELGLGGGDWEIGYDFVKTEDGGQWHIWMNGEVIIIDADDDSVGTRLTAFMTQADKRAQAIKDSQTADSALGDAIVGTVGGAAAALGGIVLGIPSCAATPLTFWAAGGTGWGCAAGVLAAGYGGTLMGTSVNGILRANKDRSDAAKSYRDSGREAEELFGSIKDEVTNNQ